MSLLSDILNALDRWDEWRAMRAAPGRVDSLEKRVQALEDQLGDSSGGNICSHCGSRNIRTAGSRPHPSHFGQLGVRETRYLCLEKDCGKETWIMDQP